MHGWSFAMIINGVELLQLKDKVQSKRRKLDDQSAQSSTSVPVSHERIKQWLGLLVLKPQREKSTCDIRRQQPIPRSRVDVWVKIHRFDSGGTKTKRRDRACDTKKTEPCDQFSRECSVPGDTKKHQK
ncbi:hypothetical protein Bca101_030166 [Brassica carinata]